MSEADRLMVGFYRRHIEEREKEIALYESGVRTLEGRGPHCKLVDVTEETIARLQVECTWYQKLIADRTQVLN